MKSETGLETAYYYPEPYWLMREGGWIKSLLLCFDQIAVLLPNYMSGQQVAADPVLAGPLLDSGHLIVLEPETFVDATVAEQLAEAMVELITAGVFDRLAADHQRYAELSMSRMGAYGERQLFEMILEELERRGLAEATQDGVSIPLHPVVRRVYLLLLAQFARHAGARHGLDLHPTTNTHGVGTALARFLAADHMPSKGHVVQLDLSVVGISLDEVPLEEIFDYRKQHLPDHKAYMRNLRQFLGELALTDDAEERAVLYEERANDLRAGAAEMEHHVRDAWRDMPTALGFGLGIVGAGWSAAGGDQVGAAIGLGGLGVGLYSLLTGKDQGSAYSYLFSTSRDLPYARSA